MKKKIQKETESHGYIIIKVISKSNILLKHHNAI